MYADAIIRLLQIFFTECYLRLTTNITRGSSSSTQEILQG